MVLGQILTFSACHTVAQIASEPLDKPQTLFEWLTIPVRQLRLLELCCAHVVSRHVTRATSIDAAAFFHSAFFVLTKGCSWSSQKVIMM